MKDTTRMTCFQFGSSMPDLTYDVRAAPLVQIFSVSLFTEFDNEIPCEIYGSIRATDGQGTSLDLYNRDLDDCETMSKDGTLSLTGPESYAILGSKGVTIDVNLKDKIRGNELIRGRHYLDSMREDSYDRLMKAVFQGQHGSVYLYYTTFQFAIAAIVEVAIVTKGEGSGGFDDVYGNIAAYYKDDKQFCGSDDEVKHLKTSLFEKPSDKSVRVTMGTPLKLLRSLVAVPAYSSLIIEAELFGSRCQFSSSPVVFPIVDSGYFIASIPSEDGCVELKIKVNWRNVYPQVYGEIKPNTKHTESKTEEPPKKVLPNEQLPSHSNQKEGVADMPQTQTPTPLEIGFCGAEIFSIYVWGINCEISGLYGTIEVYDSLDPTPIYCRDSKDPQLFPDDKFVCIEKHSAFTNPQFYVLFNLKEPVENLMISNGRISWSDGMLRYGNAMSWYDKRICSVVRGDHGYAALHYTIFDLAVIATVEVVFFCDDVGDVPHSLHGILYARYGGHEYSTDYERKYYQSRLFNRPLNKAVQLRTSSKVPLSKSVVAVPVTSPLIIEADLKAICDGNLPEEVVSGVEAFMVDLSSTTSKKFRGNFCHIEVSVRFEDPF